MFKTELLKNVSSAEQAFRYLVIATSVAPLICIFVYSAVLNKRHGGRIWQRQAGDTSAIPPWWVFLVMWICLTILWALVVINSAMELDTDALVALFVYHLVATVMAVMWLWASDKMPKQGAGTWFMAALLLASWLMYSVFVGGAWSGGDKNSAWLTATLWVPMLAWVSFATILAVVDARKGGAPMSNTTKAALNVR